MYSMAGHQPATVQAIALGADKDGKLTGIRHDSVNPTSLFDGYIEYAAMASRHLWRASGGISTSHRVVHVNRNTPSCSGRLWRRKVISRSRARWTS
jgi:xanthine dehydrogenase YagR molybdenum-binding subunit